MEQKLDASRAAGRQDRCGAKLPRSILHPCVMTRNLALLSTAEPADHVEQWATDQA